MAAITTDIPLRRRSTGPRLLEPLPDVGVPIRPSSELMGVLPSAEVRRYRAAPARVAPATYRLRRAVAVLVLVAVAIAAWGTAEALAGALGVSALPAESPVSSAPASTPTTIVVAPGDTFWSIATRLGPQGDPRPLVDRLVAAHGGRQLQAGERLSVPR